MGPSWRALPGRPWAPDGPASSTSTTTTGAGYAGRSPPSLHGWAGACWKPIPTSPPPPRWSHTSRGGADVLVLAAERPGAELALREIRTLGVRWPVLGGDALAGIETDGALAEGIRLSSAYLADRQDDRNAAFVADY